MQKPLYILAAAPCEPSKLKKIFESGKDSVMDLLQNPPCLRSRSSGWDLRTFDTPRIAKGEYLEVKGGDQTLVNLYQDGTFILRAAADHTFLGWPRPKDKFQELPRLNPVAISELTYNFVNFYSELLDHFETKPAKIKFKIQIKNAFLENSQLYLVPYETDQYGWLDNDERYPAPDKEFNKELDVNTEDLINLPSQAAYQLVEKIYLWFGIELKKIPYVLLDDQNRRLIDIEKIRKL